MSTFRAIRGALVIIVTAANSAPRITLRYSRIRWRLGVGASRVRGDPLWRDARLSIANTRA